MASDRARDQLRGAFIAIVAAVIAAAGTLVGAELANVNAREQLSAQFSYDNSVRQLELRRDAYTKFIAAASQARMDLIILAGQVEKNQSTSATELKELLGHFAQFATLTSDVQIVGSRKAAALALPVLMAYEHVFTLNNPSADKVMSTANIVEAARSRFVNAVGAELNKQ